VVTSITRQKGSQPYGDDWKLISKKSWALSDFNFDDAYILIPNKKKEEEEDPYSHNVLLSAMIIASNGDVRKSKFCTFFVNIRY
jgi:hypothetical protein